VLYITERAVFRLVHPHQQPSASGAHGGNTSSGTSSGTTDSSSGGSSAALELIEVAPGVEIERDILPLMGFAPLIPKGGVRQMPAEIFQA
jgi:acyl CoA:acetate/3-ketoacid CoA transferase